MSLKYNIPTVIRDKYGKEYSLISDLDDVQWIFRVRSLNRKMHVAQANCLPNEDELRLMDFHLEKDFRRIGLGSALLAVIVQTARKDFKFISGVIKSNDLRVFPNLLNWYAERGFSVNICENPIAIRQSLDAHLT